MSKEQKHYLQEHRIEHQTLMPYSPQQNGRAECFQQTIISKAESMRHAAGLSDGFWKHAVGTAVHVYNVTPISKAEFLMSNQQVRSADYLGMQSVTACNDTCIRGDLGQRA